MSIYRLHLLKKNYSSWSLRPWLLMKMCGIDFEEVGHLYTGGYGENNHLKEVSPSSLLPCLQVGENLIWDSLAIAEYLYEDHPHIWPKDAKARAFARCVSSEMHAGFGALRSQCSMNCAARFALKEIPASLTKDMSRISQLIEDGLDRFGGPFLAGQDFSAADAFYAPVAFRMQSYGLEFSARAKAYFAHILALPPMQAWYEEAIVDSFLNPAHEEECLKFATLLSDARPLRK